LGANGVPGSIKTSTWTMGQPSLTPARCGPGALSKRTCPKRSLAIRVEPEPSLVARRAWPRRSGVPRFFGNLSTCVHDIALYITRPRRPRISSWFFPSPIPCGDMCTPIFLFALYLFQRTSAWSVYGDCLPLCVVLRSCGPWSLALSPFTSFLLSTVASFESVC
jgi:hypothetical protein